MMTAVPPRERTRFAVVDGAAAAPSAERQLREATAPTPRVWPAAETAGLNGFRELDDLVLDLKGLVLVRELRREGGAGIEELEMYRGQIDQARDRLARFAREGSLPQVA